MTQKEMMKLKIVNQAIGGTLTVQEADELLALSKRQVKRLKKGVSTPGTGIYHTQKQESNPLIGGS